MGTGDRGRLHVPIRSCSPEPDPAAGARGWGPGRTGLQSVSHRWQPDGAPRRGTPLPVLALQSPPSGTSSSTRKVVQGSPLALLEVSCAGPPTPQDLFPRSLRRVGECLLDEAGRSPDPAAGPRPRLDTSARRRRVDAHARVTGPAEAAMLSVSVCPRSVGSDLPSASFSDSPGIWVIKALSSSLVVRGLKSDSTCSFRSGSGGKKSGEGRCQQGLGDEASEFQSHPVGTVCPQTGLRRKFLPFSPVLLAAFCSLPIGRGILL